MSDYRLTVLGCGTSTGVPVPGCQCSVCRSGKPYNQRTRPSVFIEAGQNRNILIDVTTDFRSQALRFDIRRIDAVLYTHAHADHILGTDDLRAYNFVMKSSIPCYGETAALADIRRTFAYLFDPDPGYEGGMLADLTLHEVKALQSFSIHGLTVLPFPLRHGKTAVLGYRIGDLAYATDCNFVPEESKSALQGVKTLILDGLRFNAHRTHFTIPQAVALANELGIEKTYLTHMTHDIDYDEATAQLPSHVRLSYDGLQIAFHG